MDAKNTHKKPQASPLAKGDVNETKFLHSDSWVLLAVILASKTHAAKLADIIAAADYANHAIIARAELEIGFAHLIAAGYVAETPDGYSVSEGVKKFWQTASSKHRTVLKLWDAVAAFIGVPAWAPRSLPETAEEHFVTVSDYAAAIEVYQQIIRQAMDRVLKPKKK